MVARNAHVVAPLTPIGEWARKRTAAVTAVAFFV